MAISNRSRRCIMEWIWKKTFNPVFSPEGKMFLLQFYYCKLFMAGRNTAHMPRSRKFLAESMIAQALGMLSKNTDLLHR